MLLSALIKPEYISELLLDMFGNYVVQKILAIVDMETNMYILRVCFLYNIDHCSTNGQAEVLHLRSKVV